MAQELKKDEEASDTAPTGCGIFNFFKKKKEFDRHARKEEPSCDKDNEEKKKKGLKEKIKENMWYKKDGENTKSVEKTNGIANCGTKSRKIKGFLEKIKDKFPGQYTKAENQVELKDKKGILNNNDNEKLPEGHNKGVEKQKEN